MIGLGIIFLLVVFLGLIKHISDGRIFDFLSGGLTLLFQGIQVIFFIVFGVYNLKNDKYYIEWDDQQVRFFLPQTKQLEVINIEDIQSIEVRLFEIELQLEDQNHALDLNTMQDKALKQVKAKFKALQEIRSEETDKSNHNQ